MVNYQYAYLTGDLVLLAVWFILFFWRKNTRKIMLFISLIFGVGGLIVEPIYASDWWHPLTIAGMIPGIESFLFGFAVGGIASVIYIDLYHAKLRKRKIRTTNLKEEIRLFTIILLLLGIFLGCFYILKLNSFISSLPATLIPVFIIWWKRKDLIFDSIASGILLTLVSFGFYLIPELISPGWIASTWNFHMFSGILLFKIPIEEFIWYFISGLLIGPLYEYWKDEQINKSKLEKEVDKEIINSRRFIKKEIEIERNNLGLKKRKK